MEYLNEIEEPVFEPQFGYGYEPDARKRKKKKGNAEAEREHFTGMKKPLANPLVPLFVSILFAAILLVCVLLATFSKKPEVTARMPQTQTAADAACAAEVSYNEDV